MALDGATTSFLAQLAESGSKALHEMSPTEARALTAGLRELYGTGPEVHATRDLTVPVSGGEIRVRVLTPTPTPHGLLVYYHGGGWVLGTVEEFDTLGRVLAQRTGMAVALVDYRLAPEHRYPTAVEDSWAALRWLATHRTQTAADGPLVVAGDSAGGTIAAVMAQRAAAAGGPRIDLQVLVYPVTDAPADTGSYTDPDNQLMLSREAMVWFWDHYAPDPAGRAAPDAAPLHAADLAGLAPALVLTAEHDVLRDEGEAYARRLAWAGVPVRHQRFAGQMHGFFTMVNVLPGSGAGLDYVTAALDELRAAQPA